MFSFPIYARCPIFIHLHKQKEVSHENNECIMILLKMAICHRWSGTSQINSVVKHKLKTKDISPNALDLFNILFISNLCGMSLKIKACDLACT